MTSFDLRSTPFILLDDSRPAHRAGQSLFFHSPDYIIKADTFDDLPRAFAELDEAYAAGLHVAGWIAYEAAAAFEPKLAALFQEKTGEPLVWLMATRHRQSLKRPDVERLFYDSAHGNKRRSSISTGTAAHTEADYKRAIEQVLAYIQAGDVYQINHTFPLPIEIEGDPVSLYETLRANQPVPYGALINTGETQILSLSPELFIERKGDTLTARPMKGTAPRGTTTAEDLSQSNFLKSDEKSRAENLMIVDLIRNDLSKIATPKSVRTERLFETEKYPTLFQMTSTVTATARETLSPSALLSAMFPCGSVTGAPKIRAMEIIHELETGPRGVYCGSIGHFSPASVSNPADWTLNVPIRTLILEEKQKQDVHKGRLSVGSGIVADSAADAEYEECLLKAKFVHRARTVFSLIETMRLEEGGYLYKEHHLGRLRDSAAFFDFSWNEAEVERSLADHANATAGDCPRRCRLLLDQSGAVTLSSQKLANTSYMGPEHLEKMATADIAGTIALASTPINAENSFRRHKTTNRQLYDAGIADAFRADHLDLAFFNTDGALAEGAISNFFLLLDGAWVTPRLEDGALPGILRGKILADQHTLPVSEQRLSKTDLAAADCIVLANALRGLRRVRLANTP